MQVPVVINNVAQLHSVRVDMADLTIIVGPQASGKSIFLQLFKLIFDAGHINHTLRKSGLQWQGDQIGPYRELARVLREGGHPAPDLSDATDLESVLRRCDAEYHTDGLAALERVPPSSVDFTFSQAVLEHVARDEFSESIRLLMEAGLGAGKGAIFPQSGRMKQGLREALAEGIFAGTTLKLDAKGLQKRIVLDTGKSALPYMVWSAGQREFIPLLLGLYRLLPSSKASKVRDIDWVVIEEPEAGLHPRAIAAILLAVLELLDRGYRVVVSTHSPYVLDLVWGMNALADNAGRPELVLDMLGVPRSGAMTGVASRTLQKSRGVYFFERTEMGVESMDISGLDPGADALRESGWGGLTEFSGPGRCQQGEQAKNQIQESQEHFLQR